MQTISEELDVDVESDRDQLRDIVVRQAANQTVLLQLQSIADSRAQGNPGGTFWTLETFESWAQRIGVVLLLMFLVTIFSTLYRYSLRMAAFFDGRADALMLHWMDETNLGLTELTAIFGSENIDFARARSPADHAFDLAGRAIDVAAKQGK